jgi:NADPH:quinone reductase
LFLADPHAALPHPQAELMSGLHYRAVVCEALGPPERLCLRSLPQEPLVPGAARVALKAAGVNFPDVLMIQGHYQHKPALPFVPGLEAAGVVAECAPDVQGLRAGDRVMLQMHTGGYA